MGPGHPGSVYSRAVPPLRQPEQQSPLPGQGPQGPRSQPVPSAAFPRPQISPVGPPLQLVPLRQGPSPSCSLPPQEPAGVRGSPDHTMCLEQKWLKAELALQGLLPVQALSLVASDIPLA